MYILYKRYSETFDDYRQLNSCCVTDVKKRPNRALFLYDATAYNPQ